VKYLKMTVTGPYVNTDYTTYAEVADDFDPEGKDAQEAGELLENAVWEYVESWAEVVDEDDVSENERP
jgi:hypothetical protein